MLKNLECILFLFLTINSYSQKEKPDTLQLKLLATSIDSIEAKGENVGRFIVRKSRHTGYDVDIHYTIDTISKTLLKCSYYEYFQGFDDTVLYKTTFYYDNGYFKLAELQTSSKVNEVSQGKLYFLNGQGEIVQVLSSTNTKTWDLKRIQMKTKEFLLDFAGILAMIEKRKNSN